MPLSEPITTSDGSVIWEIPVLKGQAPRVILIRLQSVRRKAAASIDPVVPHLISVDCRVYGEMMQINGIPRDFSIRQESKKQTWACMRTCNLSFILSV